LWDASTGEELAAFPGQQGGVASAVFSPDGKRIVLASRRVVEVWDIRERKRIHSLAARTDPPFTFSLAISPDGRRIAVGFGDWTVQVFDLETGQHVLTVRDKGSAYGLAFSPDGHQLATADDNRAVTLWDADTGREVARLRGHTSLATAVAFSPDGQRLASAGDDGTVRVWDARARNPVICSDGPSKIDPGYSFSLSFSPDGQRLATSDRQNTIRVWNTTTGEMLSSLVAENNGLAFSRDSRHLALACSNGTVRVIDPTTGRELLLLRGHLGPVLTVAYSPDGQRILSAGFDGSLRLWDAKTGHMALLLVGEPDAASVSQAIFSQDGSRIFSVRVDGTWTAWDAASGRELRSRRWDEGVIGNLVVSPDGKSVIRCSRYEYNNSMTMPDSLTVWDVEGESGLRTLRGHFGAVVAAAFSPDGTRIATGGRDYIIRLWDRATGEELFALYGHPGSIRQLAFSPDGRRLASASSDDFSARLWDAGPVKEERPAPSTHTEHQLAGTGLSPVDEDIASRVRRARADRYIEQAVSLGASKDPRTRDTTRAVTMIQKAIELEPRHAPYWKLLGLILNRAGRWSEAVSANEQAMKLDSEDASVLNNLAFALTGNADATPSDAARAVELTRRATEKAPTVWRLWRTLGRAHRRAGDPKAAKEAWNKAIEVGRDDPEAHSEIARLLANDADPQVRDTTNARALAEKAVHLAPKSGECYSSLGQVQYRIGDWKASLATLGKAAELQDGGMGIDLFFMAMAHCQAGSKDRAIEFYERGMQWIETYAPLDEELRGLRSEAALLIGLTQPTPGTGASNKTRP
jgi:WD40 repeat protein/Flp pilus assembly protein TadD